MANESSDSREPAPDSSLQDAAEAPAPRAQPLRHSEKSDAGCLVLLFVCFVGIFFIPAVFLLGGAPLIIPLIVILLTGIVATVVNPWERRGGAAKWWGRIVIFLIITGLLAGLIFWIRSLGEALPVSDY